MNFKKHSWIKYGNNNPETIAKIILERDGKVLDKATWELQDKDSERKIFTIFKHKYGLFRKPENDLKYIK